MATKGDYPRFWYEDPMRDNNAKKEHYANRAAYEKSKGRMDNAAADNHMANMAERENEVIYHRAFKPNSREQYQHEKSVGDPSARDLSYEEWKKL